MQRHLRIVTDAIKHQRHVTLVRDLAAGKPAHLRSPEWQRVRKAHLVEEPCCRWCGGTTDLQVHHKHPFHLAPALELDPKNLITLCETGGFLSCHLWHGHNGDWQSFNDQIEEQCAAHLCTPNHDLVERIRREDPELYEFLTNARRAREGE